MTAAPTPLAADLQAGLKRLKLATVRRIAPQILQTATTQRWKPDEVLRTLVEAEIAARDETNRRKAGQQRNIDTRAAQIRDGLRTSQLTAPTVTPPPHWLQSSGRSPPKSTN